MELNQFGVDMSQYAPNEENIFNRGWNFLKGAFPSGDEITKLYGENEGEGSVLAGTKESPSYNISLRDMWRNYVSNYNENVEESLEDTEYTQPISEDWVDDPLAGGDITDILGGGSREGGLLAQTSKSGMHSTGMGDFKFEPFQIGNILSGGGY